MALLELAQHGLSFVGIVLFCIVWWMHLVSIVYVRWHMHRRAQQNLLPSRYPEGVSLLKPLKGVDPNLAGNLETFFTLDYERYEVLLCVQDADDPAIEVCEALLEKYPAVDAKLCVGGRKVGMNPKINNLMPGYEAAKYKLVWICDSGIRVQADTLTDLTDRMTDKVGMVHGMPYVADREGLAAAVEQVYFGTWFARLYVTAHVTGIKCVAGMSCLMRKELLDQAGGLEAFAQYMGEDYFMAKAIADRGWKFALATQVAMQNCGSCSIAQFQSRMIRWTKIRINTLPTTAVEPMSACFLASLIIAWAARNVFMWNRMAFFWCHCLAWFVADYVQLRGVHGGALRLAKWKYAVAWFIRESLVMPTFLLALWGRAAISWREGRYRLYCGGTAEEVMDVREGDKRGIAWSMEV